MPAVCRPTAKPRARTARMASGSAESTVGSPPLKTTASINPVRRASQAGVYGKPGPAQTYASEYAGCGNNGSARAPLYKNDGAQPTGKIDSRERRDARHVQALAPPTLPALAAEAAAPAAAPVSPQGSSARVSGRFRKVLALGVLLFLPILNEASGRWYPMTRVQGFTRLALRIAQGHLCDWMVGGLGRTDGFIFFSP